MSDEENKDETTGVESEGEAENTGGPDTAEKTDTVSVEDLVGDQGNTDAASGDDARPDLGLILDIPVTLSLELGSTTINLGDLLKLNKGSVVALEKEASEPLDVKVNGTLIAFAEVVVINDRYGIRLIDVVSESERLKKLS